MNSVGRLLCWGSFAIGLFARAQDVPRLAEGAPSPPFVDKAPVPSTWEIRISYPASPGGESRFLKKVSVTKTGDKKHEVFVWSDGVQSETWHVAGYVLYQQPHFVTGDVAVLEEAKYLYQGDFPNLAWVGKESYRGLEKRGGRLCHYYEGSPALGALDKITAGQSAPPPVFRAWIDVETRLPVAVDRPGLIEDYSFSREGPEILALPPLYARKLEEYLARKKAIKPLPPVY